MKLARFVSIVSPVKWFLAVVLALGLAGCSDNDDDRQETTTFSAALSGTQEVPRNPSTATGIGTLALDLPSRTIRGNIVIAGMTATAAHIHVAEAGVNGPVIVDLIQTSPGTWSVPLGATLTEAQAAALSAGGLYFNAHSVAFPGGEIRGQIGREVFAVPVSPSQEVPSNASTASGRGLLVLDPATRKFKASITITGMTATAAHIHQAPAGSNGPVIFPLTETATGSGVWVAAADASMTEAQVASLRAGGLYFNAHSVAFPGGEIRGQIGREVIAVSMSPLQEVPPPASTATGRGLLVLDPETRRFTASVTVSGMTATAAHIHQAPAGSNGPVIFPLTETAAGSGVWVAAADASMTEAQLVVLRAGGMYFNAHSVAFPGGEVRGQINAFTP